MAAVPLVTMRVRWSTFESFAPLGPTEIEYGAGTDGCTATRLGISESDGSPTRTLGTSQRGWITFAGVLKTPQSNTSRSETVSRVVGYFCIARVKFLYALYGSPLAGPGRHLGPVVDPNVDQTEFVRCLVRHCRSNRFARLEISNDWLDERMMKGMGFRVSADVMHVCPLDGGDLGVWARMKGVSRTRIRKAEHSGLRAETTEDPAIVDLFYSQFTGFKAKASDRSVLSAHLRSLFRHLVPADRLFAIQVKHEDRVVATGLYPYNKHALCYLDSGYDPAYVHLASNDLLHGTAIKLEAARGIPIFRIASGRSSRFTQKFGGTGAPYLIYRKSSVPLVETVRAAYLVRRRIARKAWRVSLPWSHDLETDRPRKHPDRVATEPSSARWLMIVQPNQSVIVDRRQGPLDESPLPESRSGERRSRARPVASVYVLETAGGAE